MRQSYSHLFSGKSIFEVGNFLCLGECENLENHIERVNVFKIMRSYYYYYYFNNKPLIYK